MDGKEKNDEYISTIQPFEEAKIFIYELTHVNHGHYPFPLTINYRFVYRIFGDS